MGALIAVGVLAIVGVVFYAVNSGYDSRRHVGEAIAESAPAKAAVEEFVRKRGALPAAADAAVVRAGAQLKRARAVEWLAKDRMVVITMEPQLYRGKRFGYVAEVEGGRVEWKCRTIDLEAKYLPAACR